MALVKDNNNISLPIKRRLLLLILLGVQLVYASANGNGIMYPLQWLRQLELVLKY